MPPLGTTDGLLFWEDQLVYIFVPEGAIDSLIQLVTAIALSFRKSTNI